MVLDDANTSEEVRQEGVGADCFGDSEDELQACYQSKGDDSPFYTRARLRPSLGGREVAVEVEGQSNIPRKFREAIPPIRAEYEAIAAALYDDAGGDGPGLSRITKARLAAPATWSTRAESAIPKTGDVAVEASLSPVSCEAMSAYEATAEAKIWRCFAFDYESIASVPTLACAACMALARVKSNLARIRWMHERTQEASAAERARLSQVSSWSLRLRWTPRTDDDVWRLTFAPNALVILTCSTRGGDGGVESDGVPREEGIVPETFSVCPFARTTLETSQLVFADVERQALETRTLYSAPIAGDVSSRSRSAVLGGTCYTAS